MQSALTLTNSYKKLAVPLAVTAAVILGIFAFANEAKAVAATTGGGPQNGQTGVPPGAIIDRIFDGALSSATVNTTNVLLQVNTGNTQGGAPSGSNLCTTVNLTDSGTRIECLHSELAADTWHTFTITTNVQDSNNAAITAQFTAAFQTGSFVGGAAFNPPPDVLGSIPPNGGTLPINGKIVVKFSRPMAVGTASGSVINTKNIQILQLDANFSTSGSNLLTGTTGWTYAGDALTIPNSSLGFLVSGAKYRLIVKGDNGDPAGCVTGSGCVKSTDGLAMPGPDFNVDFTAAAADNTAPTLLGSFPDNNAAGVNRAEYDFALSFNESLDPTSITSSTVKLYCNDTDANSANGCNGTGTTIDGNDVEITTVVVSFDPDLRVIHLSPSALLPASSNFLIRVVSGASGLKDIVGNALGSDIVRAFSTGANTNGQATDNTAPQILFANADNFGVFVTFNEAMKFNVAANTNGTTSDGANDANNILNWTIESSSDGTNFTKVPLTAAIIEYEPDNTTLIIENVVIPPGQTFRVTGATAIQDLAGNGLAANNRTALGTVLSSAVTGGQLGPGGGGSEFDFFTFGADPVEVFPKSGLAGVTTRYRVSFRSTQAIPGSGKITLSFPSGFAFAATCTTLPTDNFENTDINGQGTGTVTIASVACDATSRVITITLGAAATQANDRLSFEIQGITNTTVARDFTSNGYRVDVKTYNASGVMLETLSSMPFFISQPGQRTISGVVFDDNGAGGGTANDGVRNGSEAGIDGIKVCLGGMVGFQCASTANGGAYSFGSLPNGFYRLDIPPITTGTFTGGPFFRDVNVSGSDVTVNFGIRQAATAFVLDVYVSGGSALANKKLDVFGFSSQGTAGATFGGPGGFVVRELTLDGSGIGTAALPLTAGLWEVGVGPSMPKDPGTAFSLPVMDFMPPKPVTVNVDVTNGVPDLCTSGAGSANELCFTLVAATLQIKGKIVDGTGAAIKNAFVIAHPSQFGFDDTFGQAVVAQSDVNGNFNVNVKAGSYLVHAFVEGIGETTEFECTVIANTGASDNNSTADVICEGTLIVNDVAGFSGTSLALANVTNNDLVLTVAKGDTSIAGTVSDENGAAVSFAHVFAEEVDSSGNPIGRIVDSNTNNAGTYTLYVTGGTQASPKKWKVCAFLPGFGQLPCQTFNVAAGQNLSGKNFQTTASNFVTVTGTIFIDTNGNSAVDSGEGVTGAHVFAFGSAGGNGTVSGSGGAYTLKVPSGTGYTIEGFIPGQGPTQSLTNQNFTSNASNVNLSMARPGTIVVYVCTLADTNSDPSANNGCGSNQITTAFVDARESNGRGNGTSSNTTSGKYEIVVPAGTYTVRASNTEIGDIGSQANVAVSGGATVYVNFAPPARFTVSGTVSSANSACVESVYVSFIDAANGRMTQARANAAGAFSTILPNGTYEVIGLKRGCVDNANKGQITVSGANLTQANDTDLARTMVKTDATVTGRAFIDQNGNNNADSGENVSVDTMISATSGTGQRVILPADLSKTGTSNNYTLDLAAGTWQIQARADGFESSKQSIVVTAGGSVSVQLQLTAISGVTAKSSQTSSVTPTRGGVVKNTDIGANFELNIPAGSLGQSSNPGSVVTKETLAVADTDLQNVIGDKGVSISAKDSSGSPITTLSGSAATIKIPYTDADVTAAGGTEENLVISRWSTDKQQWEAMSTNCDTTNNICSASVTQFSDYALTVPQSGAPATPSGLTATDSGGGTVRLAWNTVSGAASYNVYRSTDNVSFPLLASGVTATTYNATGQPSSTLLHFKVSSVATGGAESAGGSAASITLSAGSSAGGGGGASPASTASVTVTAPNGGETLTAGTSTQITWTATGNSITSIRLKLSSDSGLAFPTTIVASTTNDGSYEWTVPDLSGSRFRVKIEALDVYGTVVFSDLSDRDFTISAAAPSDQPAEQAPAREVSEILPPGAAITDVTVGARFDKLAARNASPSINADFGLTVAAEAAARHCESNTLIKGASNSAVYYCGADGKRYVFPGEKVYFTWFSDFSDVITVSDATLAQINLGGVVTYRPGVKLVKIESDPKVYAVGRGGLLRWVTSEALAASLYGEDWNRQIDDVAVSFFARYKRGPDITE